MSSDIVWHQHHIIPLHDNGTNDPSNLLTCNIAMHAFLHKLRWEELGQWQDKLAWRGLAGLISKDQIILQIDEHRRKKMRIRATGRLHSLETRQKMSLAHRGRVFSETHLLNLRKPKSTSKEHNRLSRGRPRDPVRGCFIAKPKESLND